MVVEGCEIVVVVDVLVVVVTVVVVDDVFVGEAKVGRRETENGTIFEAVMVVGEAGDDGGDVNKAFQNKSRSE